MTRRSEDIKPGALIGWQTLRDIGIGDRPVVTAGAGIGVTSDSTRVVVRNTAPNAGQRVILDALIVDFAVESENKWSYGWREQVLKTYPADPAEFLDKDPARDSAQYGRAMNRYEIPNGPTGVQGNGVDVGNLVGTFALQPITPGVVVRLELVTPSDGSQPIPWISEPNGVDGQCPANPAQGQYNQYLLEQHPPP